MELRVKVAELRGWENIGPDGRHMPQFIYGNRKGTVVRERIPDYCNDLNACAEFRKSLTRKQHGVYGNILWDMLHPKRDHVYAPYWFLIDATAQDHCRAFVKTMEAPSVPEVTKSDEASGASTEKG